MVYATFSQRGSLLLHRVSFRVPLLLGLWTLLAVNTCSPGGEIETTSYGRVELFRDHWGIPHVFSETDAGAMYGLGRAVAEDRGFQMTYNLRSIQGRLAEVLGDILSERSGATALSQDIRMRTVGFYRAAERVSKKLDRRTEGLLEAYCRGINDWFAEHPRDCHPLFKKLNFNPEPWHPADCIASLWHLGQFFSGDGLHKLEDYREHQKAPPQLAPENKVDDAAAIVQRSDVSDDWVRRLNEFQQAYGVIRDQVPIGPEGPKFSHAWSVGGKKSTTGKSVLVGDPQTPVLNPSLFYEFHICGKSFNTRGISAPGSPGLLIGWNEHFAWSVTALGADQADLFRLKTDPARPNQYQLNGEWKEMEVIPETILVKGGQPHELLVKRTHFGPVVTHLASALPGDPEVALRRIPQFVTESDTIQGLLGLMRAGELDEFKKALAYWQFPSTNLVFGDRQGNVGYWLQAGIPIRSKHDLHHGQLAVDGSDTKFDWRGLVPHEFLPHVINPARGWVASGNHRAIESFYPIRLGSGKGSTGHTIRSLRLYERLSQLDRFRPSDVLDIHFDTTNPGRRDIVRFGLHLRDRLQHPLPHESTEALKHLEEWYKRGAKLDLTIPGTALASQIPIEFRAHTTPLANKYGGAAAGLALFIAEVSRRLDANPSSKLEPDEVNFVQRALSSAWTESLRLYGSNLDEWHARALQMAQKKSLGYMSHLNGFGSLDPAADLSLPSLTCIDTSTIKSQLAQAYTQYVPFDDLDSALSLLPPGNSEQIGNAWRTATMQMWSEGKLHPAPLSRKAVEQISGLAITLSK